MLPFLNMGSAVRRPSVNDAPEPAAKRQRVVTPVNERITAIEFIDRLIVTEEESMTISKYEQKSQAWLDARKGRITASNFGAAVGRNPYQTRRALLKQMLWSSFRGNVATRWGCDNEPVACETYVVAKQLEIAQQVDRVANASEEEKDSIVTELYVEERGLVINPERPWMGNSPDGIVHVTYASGRKEVALLEIKCPFKKVFYPDTVPTQYMAQIQGTMGNLKLPWCDFVVWTPTETQITRVPFDPTYWNEMLVGLTEFYFHEYVPAAVHKENGLLGEGEVELAIDIDLSGGDDNDENTQK